ATRDRALGATSPARLCQPRPCAEVEPAQHSPGHPRGRDRRPAERIAEDATCLLAGRRPRLPVLVRPLRARPCGGGAGPPGNRAARAASGGAAEPERGRDHPGDAAGPRRTAGRPRADRPTLRGARSHESGSVKDFVLAKKYPSKTLTSLASTTTLQEGIYPRSEGLGGR